jgi:predicted O-methyltransferase YrrM
VLRNSTVEAAAYFADESVDFVYVDARHDYTSVKQDLETWWPKVKRGGILAGHDYVTADEIKHWEGPCPHLQKLSSQR